MISRMPSEGKGSVLAVIGRHCMPALSAATVKTLPESQIARPTVREKPMALRRSQPSSAARGEIIRSR